MKKSKPNQKKSDAIADIGEKIGRAKAFFLTDYKGLTHKQLEELRKNLKKVEAEYSIVKNTLFKKSLEEKNVADTDKIADSLKQPTAAFFAYGDGISAIKALSDFAKATALPKIKIGMFDSKLASADDFKMLASLPSREILLATIVNRLQSPISGLHYSLNWNLIKIVNVLNNIKNKKPQAAN